MRVTVTRTGDLDPIVRELERGLRAGQKAAGREVGRVARKEVLADVKSSRGSLRFAGGRLGIKTEVDANQTSSRVTLVAAPAGAWSIVEFGRGRSVPVRAKALHFGGADLFAMSSRAVAGRRYWDAATSRLDASLRPTVEAAVESEMT